MEYMMQVKEKKNNKKKEYSCINARGFVLYVPNWHECVSIFLLLWVAVAQVVRASVSSMLIL